MCSQPVNDTPRGLTGWAVKRSSFFTLIQVHSEAPSLAVALQQAMQHHPRCWTQAAAQVHALALGSRHSRMSAARQLTGQLQQLLERARAIGGLGTSDSCGITHSTAGGSIVSCTFEGYYSAAFRQRLSLWAIEAPCPQQTPAALEAPNDVAGRPGAPQTSQSTSILGVEWARGGAAARLADL